MIPIRDSIITGRAPYVVVAIIVINFAVFLFQETLSPPNYYLFKETPPPLDSYLFLFKYGLVPLRYSDPAWALSRGLNPNDYWPFLFNLFMHGGWVHIILNMWTLYIFGRSIEGRFGSLPFLIFYLLCGIAANLVHIYFNAKSPLPIVGASGAIAGVIGAYALTFPRARLMLMFPIIFIPFFFELPALVFALIWFILQLIQGTGDLLSPSIGGVAWWAHIGGFVAGIVLLPLLRLGGTNPVRYRTRVGRGHGLPQVRPWHNTKPNRHEGSGKDKGGDDPGSSEPAGPWG